MPTSLRIAIAAPGDGEAGGDQLIVDRWAGQLTAAGHTVDLVTGGNRDASVPPSADLASADLLLALDAARSAATIDHFDALRPGRPVALALTDLTLDLHEDAAAHRSIDRADRLVTFHSAALDHLPNDAGWSSKALVIHPSVTGYIPPRQPPFDEFRVVVLAHLRDTNDPLLAARAAALMPPTSRVAVHHGGRAETDDWLLQATAESGANHRYVWHGELNPIAARELLASAHVLACTSLVSGTVDVVAEGIAIGVPIIATRIDGSVELLGTDHPGLFATADAMACAETLDWLELSPKALGDLGQRSLSLQHLVDPMTEQQALDALVRSL